MEQNRRPRNKTTHLIFNKGYKNMHWRKDGLFNNWLSACRRLNSCAVTVAVRMKMKIQPRRNERGRYTTQCYGIYIYIYICGKLT
jgi:hypothetical protein